MPNSQPIPKKVSSSNPGVVPKKTFNTLLIDGSNILELSSLGDKTVSSNGKYVGGIYQFLLQIKIMLQKAHFRYIFVMWDGVSGGIMRYRLNKDYKANRDKNYEEYDTEGLSDYMKSVNEGVRNMKKYFASKNKDKFVQNKKEKEVFYEQRGVIIDCLEELFIRQCVVDEVEADDLIAFYVLHKKPEERIVIMSNDKDLTQLISEDVIVYSQRKKKFITSKNSVEELGYLHENVLLNKMICGDQSDNIKGVKGLGETTLIKNFPELKKKKVTLEEILGKARKINLERANEKKKPLKWVENLVNGVTDGSQGNDLYGINRKIIDLKHPLVTKEAEELMIMLMYEPMDEEDRNFDNLYNILCKAGVDELTDYNSFSNFFTEFSLFVGETKKNQKKA